MWLGAPASKWLTVGVTSGPAWGVGGACLGLQNILEASGLGQAQAPLDSWPEKKTRWADSGQAWPLPFPPLGPAVSALLRQ